jgi:uncharacterized coiled-coil protein SlyX
MEETIIQMQEILSHQSEDIARMSDELYTQQREIIALREQLAKLQSKLEAAPQDELLLPQLNNYEKPPHY